MKTQISIQVKNENWISRCMSIYMGLGLLVKAKVHVFVDSENAQPIILKARKEPYLIDVEPGTHRIFFLDPKAKSKAIADRLFAGFFGATMGMAAGNGFAGMAMASESADFAEGLMGHSKEQDNLLECVLNEGDILKIRIQPKRSGRVAVKLL